MGELLGFVVEKTIVNSVAILPATGIVALVLGPGLGRADINALVRVVLYAVLGAGAGLWSYAVFDIPDRNLEAVEGVILGSGMFVFAFAAAGLVTWLAVRRRTTRERPASSEEAGADETR